MSIIYYMSNGDYIHFNFDAEDVRRSISELKDKKGWSSYTLALNSDMRNSVLRRIETGQREPSLKTLLKIIDGLEMTPSEFFAYVEKETK